MVALRGVITETIIRVVKEGDRKVAGYLQGEEGEAVIHAIREILEHPECVSLIMDAFRNIILEPTLQNICLPNI